MWEMQILSTQQGREGSYQTTDAPSSPETASEAASSPTSSITANSLEGQESSAPRPSPSPPHPTSLKAQAAPLQAVTPTLGEHHREFQLYKYHFKPLSTQTYLSHSRDLYCSLKLPTTKNSLRNNQFSTSLSPNNKLLNHSTISRLS